MSNRDSKKLTVPPRPRSRTSRRGLSTPEERSAAFTPLIDVEDMEPVVTTRPTKRDLESPLSTRLTRRDITIPPEIAADDRGMRGQYSISSVRGIPADVVSGSIDNTTRKQRRSTGSIPVVPRVHLAAVTRREITVIVRDQPLTMTREDAIALASIIQTAFS